MLFIGSSVVLFVVFYKLYLLPLSLIADKCLSRISVYIFTLEITIKKI